MSEWTKTQETVDRWLEETGSSWVPGIALGHCDLKKELQNGDLVYRKSGKHTYITFPYFDEMEKRCAKRIFARCKPYPMDEETVENLISEYELQFSEKEGFDFHFCEEQKCGIKTLVSNRLAILTGGPGTGKTTVLSCVAYVLKKTAGRHLTIQFTAPTGKAAKRITESTGCPASTIQKYTGGLGGTKIKVRCPDFLFVDEFSMCDLETLDLLFESIMPNTRIFLLGDTNQLPSVGIGAVLRDMIDSGVVPCTQLMQTFRQDTSSILFDNIQIIKEGGHIPLQDGSDFKNIRTEENVVQNCITEYLEGCKKYGQDETIILTAQRKKGTICSDTLNREIQAIVNPPDPDKGYLKTRVQRDGYTLNITFREGDPVIQLENEEEVANGEVGRIISIEDGVVEVEFTDEVVEYYGRDLDALDLAYAMTIHKSQGSQYKCVIMPLLRENKALDRNLIYTGVSRAKQYCVVIGEDENIQAACKRRSDQERVTFLAEEIEICQRVRKLQFEMISKIEYCKPM